MLLWELCQLRRWLVKISIAPAVGTAKQLGPLPQQLSQAKSFVLVVSELQPISPFKYILDFNVQLLIFLFPYPCLQITNCSATSLRNRITDVSMNSRQLRRQSVPPGPVRGRGAAGSASAPGAAAAQGRDGQGEVYCASE